MHENSLLPGNSLAPVPTAAWPAPGAHALLGARDGLLVVDLHGDVDLANATPLRDWLDSVVALRAPAYVVDLRRTTFIDSTGLNLVLRFRRRVRESEAGFAVVCAPRTVRLLRAHGTLDVLDPEPGLPEAASRIAGR
ncbi:MULTISPECIES: STAS domain-containing protein [unclassified Streptomyces]|uniref:STAS domain-containing protein n=1 Tax=unclassified Streptomyces TaxID=2593676 RepID=UPI002E29E22C|nr:MULTISPECIES: STAS domain-containing protein [unclassified Streptomyces]